jgi:hypothetical protein
MKTLWIADVAEIGGEPLGNFFSSCRQRGTFFRLAWCTRFSLAGITANLKLALLSGVGDCCEPLFTVASLLVREAGLLAPCRRDARGELGRVEGLCVGAFSWRCRPRLSVLGW